MYARVSTLQLHHLLAPLSQYKKQTMQLLATYGLPKSIVTGSASCFTSAEFRKFIRRNGIQHTLSILYYPTTNGLVERAVQTVKYGLKKTEGLSMEIGL